MTKRNRIFIVVALIAGICMGSAGAALWYHSAEEAQEPARTLQDLYQQAIDDSVVAEDDEILPLVEITEDSDLVTWNESKDKVLMMTFHKYPDSYPEGEDVTVQWGYVWTFSGKEFLSRYDDYGEVNDWNLRLKQLLGLPEESGQTHVTAMWVSPKDLLRPAYVTDITRQMSNSFSDAADDPARADPEYTAWFNENAVYSYCENKFPWTRLGYTYDWADNGEEYGLSEFLVRDGSEVTVEFTKTLEEFISWAEENRK
ncbi:MAG: hypothetical protein ACI4VM_01315 [Anaerovoracaceae bacterium]